MPLAALGRTTGSYSGQSAPQKTDGRVGGPGVTGNWLGCRVKARKATDGLGSKFGQRLSASRDRAGKWDGSAGIGGELLAGVGRATVFGGALCGFAFVAIDVSWASSLHALSGIDHGVHQWVAGHIPPEARDPFFEKIVSYFPLVPIFGTWSALGGGDDASEPKGSIVSCDEELGRQQLADDEEANAQGGDLEGQVGVAGKWDSASIGKFGSASEPGVSDAACPERMWQPPDALFYQFGTGTTIVMLLLKNAFHRARPGTDLHTLSFPSGHTTLAVLLTGMLVAIWLPFWEQRHGVQEDTAKRRIANFLQVNVLPIWISMWALTAAGRICADAHWLSDCIAGGLLGLASTSLMAMVCAPKSR